LMAIPFHDPSPCGFNLGAPEPIIRRLHLCGHYFRSFQGGLFGGVHKAEQSTRCCARLDPTADAFFIVYS
jgi:hypothetical protein